MDTFKKRTLKKIMNPYEAINRFGTQKDKEFDKHNSMIITPCGQNLIFIDTDRSL